MLLTSNVFGFYCIPGCQRTQAAGEPSLGNASIKPQLHGSRPLQTPTRTSLMGLPPTPASRPSRKTLGPSSVHTELNEGAGSTQGRSNKDLHFYCNSMFSSYRLSYKGMNSVICRMFSRFRIQFIVLCKGTCRHGREGLVF